MKKTVFIFIFICILSVSVYAEESDVRDDIVSSIDNELSEFEDSLPDYVKDFLPSEVFDGDFSSLTNGELSQKSFLDYVLNYLLSSLPEVLKSFSTLLALILAASIFNILKSSLGSESLKTAFSFCTCGCITIAIFSTVSSITDMCTEYIGALCGAMNTFTPIMTALYIMTGSVSSAAAANTAMLFFLSITENFIASALVPIIKICICFSIVSSLSGGVEMSGIGKLLKSAFLSICALLLSVFSFVMSYQSILTQSADSLSIRTARFAIGNFIPIVGGFVSDSLRTVSSSLSFVKNSCGVVAVIIIALLTLPVIISLLLYKLSFGLISSASAMIGCESEGKIASEAESLCGFILAVVSLTAIVFIFALTVFINSSVEVS